MFPHSSLYVGDFNYQHVNWGYNTTSPDRESLDSWATSNNLGLLYNPKQTASFFSRRWNVGNNPDLAFASFGLDSRQLDRRVLGKFPRTQYRRSLITPPRFKVPAQSDPMKRWTFCKAIWKLFFLLTGESVQRFPPPDKPSIEREYQDFCESVLSAAKHYIPRGHRTKYVSCSDKESEALYRSFTRASLGTFSASSLPSRLGQQKQERWEKAVISIDFWNSSRKAWRTINKLTGRSGRSSRRLSKRHRLATCEKRCTQDREPRVNQARQQAAVQPMEDSNTSGSQYLRSIKAGGAFCSQTPEARKVSGIGFHFPRVYTPPWVGSHILVLRLPQFLHAQTQNSEHVEKSTSSCYP